MGNSCCKSLEDLEGGVEEARGLRRPRWRSEQPLTKEELEQKREQFWDTEPHYGGDRG